MKKILDPNDQSVNMTDRLACLLGYAKLLKLQSTTMFAWLNSEADPKKYPLKPVATVTNALPP
ncbi:hypothetical protein C8F04DRAFT_1256664 [Mycena alexandri]|uniref:Uncharacterized protein n=1 Tax=Mycena alexandri TaxID=1745969 RepID=A0AAD6X3M2_9AGAR|nr:hypothetical protein C8F04DRAFT_1256664 [Mycena alexandri]